MREREREREREIHQLPAVTSDADSQDFNDNGRVPPVKITVKPDFD